MSNQGLIFIPDISGFTRFVSETDIEHSRLIMQELLEVLINSNEIGLEVSEVEGDAILFYKFGEPPELKTVYRQVQKMFQQFHQHLYIYNMRKFCQCKACLSAIHLTLKVITHYGEFSTYTIKSFNKLIGKDIIIAHQLLKNNIEQHEYWLVTQTLLNDSRPPGLEEWMKWNDSENKTENGNIHFFYTQLGRLKEELPPPPPITLNLSGKVKILSRTQEYPKDIITVFHACGDFQFRPQWQPGVMKVEEVSHMLPRVGTQCKMIMENGESIVHSASFSLGKNSVEFSEIEDKNSVTRIFKLQAINDNLTQVTIEIYIPGNWLKQAYFNFFGRKKAMDELEESMHRLEAVVDELELPD